MPLRILLPALGSSGDVHPSLELGRALKARGHRVTLATNEIFAPQAAANGLDFIALGTRAQAEAVVRDPRLWHPIHGFECVMEAVLAMMEPLYRLIEAEQGPDLRVAATSLCFGARVAQEKLGVPTATLHLQPAMFRSRADSGTVGMLPLGPRVPGFVKDLLFGAVDRLVIDRLAGPALNGFRARLGLPPVNRLFRDYVHSPQLVLGLFPDWYAPAQADWPANTRLTGFLQHDRSGEGPLPDGVERFLAAGDPPVLVTPGSAAADRHRFFETAAAACQRAGARALLVTNFPEQLPAGLPPTVHASGYLPFSRVFPRCRAVIHHGGIGTVGQAVAAGVPQLVVPNTHDQPDNGARVERLGLGLRTYAFRFSARSGAAALARLSGAGYSSRCREFAGRVDSAASATLASGLIEAMAPRSP